MNQTLVTLDREWERLRRSPEAGAALERWAQRFPVFGGVVALDDVLLRRCNACLAEPILSALARLAPEDELAARTLLQALRPGLLRMAGQEAGRDPWALEDLLALAWERIRTYPAQRRGSVAANVLFDVRKRYRAHRRLDAPWSEQLDPQRMPPGPGAADAVVERVGLSQQLRAAAASGEVSAEGIRAVVMTRLCDVPLGVAAAQERCSPHAFVLRRHRAERRLAVILTGSEE